MLSFRQLGTNLVIPGGSKTIEARGKLIIPGRYIKTLFVSCKIDEAKVLYKLHEMPQNTSQNYLRRDFTRADNLIEHITSVNFMKKDNKICTNYLFRTFKRVKKRNSQIVRQLLVTQVQTVKT